MKFKHLLFLLSIVTFGVIKSQAPVANFSINSPGCSQTNIQLTDLSTNSPTSWTWLFPSGNPSSSVSQNPIVQYSLPGTYTITLIVGNLSGNSTISQTITVGQGAGFTFAINPINICLGSSNTFTALPQVLGPPLTYSWSTGTISNTLNVNPTVTTVYTCIATSTSGCTQVRTATAVVNPLPTVTITSNPVAICTGATATLSATTSTPGPYTYTWSTAATSSAITTSVPGTYSVTLTNGNGCKGSQTYVLNPATAATLVATSNPTTLCIGNSATLSVTGATSYTWSTGGTTSNIVVTPTTATTYTVRGITGVCTGSTSIVLNVNSNPTVNATASPTSVCAGSSVTLTASGATSYTWNPGALTGSNVIVTPIASTNYSVTGSASGGCIASKTIAIAVIAMPNAVISTVSQTICSTTATLIASTPSVGTGVWTLVSGTGAIISPNSPTTGVTGISVGTNIFQWTVTNGACVATATAMIQRDLPPTISFAGNSQTICVSTPSVVLAGNTPIIGVGTWSIVSGSGTITSPNTPTSTVTGLSVGTTILQWTIVNGCSAPSTSTVAIFVQNNPSAAIAGPSQTICTTSATLNANNPLVGTGIWSLVSGTASITLPGSPTSGVSGLTTGMNVFQWTISNGMCTSSTSTVAIYVSPCTGIDQSIITTSSYAVFPNPTNGEITVSLKSFDDNTFVEVYNTLGQLILTKAASESNVKLNLSEFAEGVYQIRITNDGKQLYSAKLIKE